MSHRSWPWKKKHSEKVIAETSVKDLFPKPNLEEDDSKKIKYIQITEESYNHLTDLENEVRSLNERLSSALLEISTKDILVKQHAKVAEEAVSGWEKAEVEAIALKSQLESVILQKLAVDDKAVYLDGALKECMRQIRSVKEEGEQKLHDVVFAKIKQWEKLNQEFESKIADLNQELFKADAENNALSRSLQEHSAMLMKISDDKSRADAQVEVMKSNIQSCEKEISSLKYEVHMVSKELEIRNEEKNMSLRSADVAVKQHLEGVKKISKLEAECQRLRGLVRKRLPGPAALAQMKLEVETFGWEYGEPRVRRSPMKNSGQQAISPGEFSLDGAQSKEAEFLTARLLAMEEEMKMLKEALSKRNNELQASRKLYATTANKLQTLESQLETVNRQRDPENLNVTLPVEASLGMNTSNPPSLSSLSEDGFDEVVSITDSSLSIPLSEVSYSKKSRNHLKKSKNESPNHLGLMDDFLEMERLACLSVESNDVSSSRNASVPVFGKGEQGQLDVQIALPGMPDDKLAAPVANKNDLSSQALKTQISLEILKSRIALAFECQTKDDDCNIILEEIRKLVQDVLVELPQNSFNCVSEKAIDTGSTFISDSDTFIENEQSVNRKLKESVCMIREFMVFLQKEVSIVKGCENTDSDFIQMIDKILITSGKISSSQMGLADFVVDLSCVLSKARELGINSVGLKCKEGGEDGSSDFVDKVTLLENTVQHAQAQHGMPSTCTLLPGPELTEGAHEYDLEEFEHLKQQQDDMIIDLARCNESLEQKKFQLEEKDKLVVELRAQLAASLKSNSLNETQLKCMVESYKALETRAEDLEAQINILRRRAENLETDLEVEKHCYDNVSVKCKDLELKCLDLELKCKDLEASCTDYQLRCMEFEEKIQRAEKNPTSSSVAPETEPEADKVKQEKDIAAAAEKLAECQETIFLLSKQLKAVMSPKDPALSLDDEKPRLSTDLLKDEPNHYRFKSRNALSQDFDRTGLDKIASVMQGSDSGSPLNSCGAAVSPKAEASVVKSSQRYPNYPRHRPTKSSSSFSSVVSTPEKYGRGFGKLFSRSKGTGH